MMMRHSKNECITGCGGVNIAFFHPSCKGDDEYLYIHSYAKLGGGSNGFISKAMELIGSIT